MDISKIILAKIFSEHRGQENAITRDELLDYVKNFDSTITDRELRDIYSHLPVCVCNDGIFWPVKGKEVQDFLVYLRKKAMPMMVRSRMVAEYHSELVNSFQMELF